MKINIACVIVTYNRKVLLQKCLKAVASQTFKPVCVYITDNASTDGTMESVKEWGYYNCIDNGIEYKYILNTKNEGGAGGFYLGMKTANENAVYDALWVMDDDGEPDANCLKELVKYLGTHDYIAPIVLSSDDRRTCAFSESFDEIEVFCDKMKAHNGIIDNWASPFNGILYSKRLIDTIGYPKTEMFIWGDEKNYHGRALKAGFTPITVLAAIHYHPKNRQDKVLSFNKFPIILPNNDWKLYCYIRNLIYNNRTFNGNIKAFRAIFGFLFYYGFYFIKIHNIKRISVIANGCKDGWVSNFNNLNKYFK